MTKAASAHFGRFVTTQLSQPSPPHAFKRRWGDPAAMRTFNHKQRLQLLCLTAASGVIENLEVALESAGLLPRPQVLHAAAKAGHVHVCDWLLARYDIPLDKLGDAIGQSGSIDAFRWLMGRVRPGDAAADAACDAAYAAAYDGRADYLRWLLPQLLRVLRDSGRILASLDACKLIASAAAGCDLDTLQWPHQQWPRLEADQPPPPPPPLQQQQQQQQQQHIAR